MSTAPTTHKRHHGAANTIHQNPETTKANQ